MQKQAYHLHWTSMRVALRLVGAVALCFVALSFMAFHFTPHAYAASTPSMTTIAGSATSSPASGPVGTTITVSGSGWAVADGTSVTLGYESGSSCVIMSTLQNGTLGGNFSGSFLWPAGTGLNTFQVCAMLGSSIMAVVGSFTVLPANPPAVTIVPSTISPQTVATITASNYYPTGTQVNFSWVSGTTTLENLGSAIVNSSGTASLTFAVPNFPIASGTYTLTATAGNGQNTLSSSIPFTYQVPVVPPSPTPTLTPSPTRPPSPTPSPTTTHGVTPTVTTTPTPHATQVSPTVTTGTTPTASTSATVANNATPTTNGSTPGNTGSNNTSTLPASSSDNTFRVGAIIAVLLGLLLLGGVVAVMLINRRRKAARIAAQARPSMMVDSPRPTSWSNAQGIFTNSGAIPAAGYPSYNTVSQSGPFGPLAGNMPAPVAAGAWASTGNTIALTGNQDTLSAMHLSPSAPQQPVWMDIAPSGNSAPAMVGNANLPIAVPADPALDAMRRQAQAGLFVAPRPFSGREEPVGTP